MTPPDLTPEQMNEAVRVAIDAQSSVPAEEYNDDWGMRTVVTALLPVLFAAWQEQTAAKAGENPYLHHYPEQRVWTEGAAAGVAASEAQVRELEDALRYLANRHHSSLSPSSLHDPEHQDWTECKAFSCARVAALLSEEPGAG